MLPDNFIRDRSEITRAIERRRGVHTRTSAGELWIDHRCLFHDDAHQSASWQPDTGVYFCRAEGKTFAVPAVLDALFIHSLESEDPAGLSRGGTQSQDRPAKPPRDKRLARSFEYRFPDGRLSHTKYRVGDGSAKTIWQEGPLEVDGKWPMPEQRYPLYGDLGFDPPSGHTLPAHLIVVEGEKCVDLIKDVAVSGVDGIPITALTAGSAADLQKQADFLAARLRDLGPKTITLWPDNDEPGVRAMEYVSSALMALNVPHYVLNPSDLGLGPKRDVVDFVLGGGQLAGVVHQSQLPKLNGSLDSVVSHLVVTQDGHVVFPDTRNLVAISSANAAAIWYHSLHGMPKDSQSKELAARLTVKSHVMPTAVRPRQHNTANQTWWRPRAQGPCYLISEQGVELAPDPPETILLVPTDELAYPVDVDLDGSRADWEELAGFFHLNATEIAMCEGWLCCALAGLQTPIMFMRAPAGTGKTTLARLLLAIVEPLCPELDLSKGLNQDMRELIHTLRSSHGVLLDNVSKLSASIEDQLSKMVTGYTTTLRPLYEDRVVTTRLQRALILTTTNYDVYKGDLAERMIVTSPTTESALRWLPDSIAQQRFGKFIPRIRGWIFSRLAEFYRQRPLLDPTSIRFRVGDLGLMLAALGYDTAQLAAAESSMKSEIIAIDDPWLEALVAIWKDNDSEWFWISTADLLVAMRDYGLKELPPEKSPRLARYIAEKNPILRDHGFAIERKNTNIQRGWRFSRLGDVTPNLLSPPDGDPV